MNNKEIAFNEDKLKTEAEEMFVKEKQEDLSSAEEVPEEILAKLPRSVRRKITNKKIRIKNKKIG